MHCKRSLAGFTLIELLVVIAIIGLLASVVFASLSQARENARNARRLADINEYRKAIELYYSAHGRYPQHENPSVLPQAFVCLGDYADNRCWINNNTHEQPTFNAKLAPYLSSQPPGEPTGSVDGYAYECRNTACTSYRIGWAMEGGTNQSCGQGTSYTYASDTSITLCFLLVE